jgi:hypothetical protein
MEERIVSPSLVLHRLGSYARQNSVYRALSEIGRVQKTIHIRKTLDDEEYHRRMSRELKKGEASHDLSRFLSFGKEGAMRGREFGDQVSTFICLSILHNAVVAWNTIQICRILSDLRTEGHQIQDENAKSRDSASSQAHQPVRTILLRFKSYAANSCRRSQSSLTEVFGWMWLLPLDALGRIRPGQVVRVGA